jgi:hypothetical protein
MPVGQKGGSAKGERRGGRKRGTPNKSSIAQVRAAAAGGADLPLDLMLRIMRDKAESIERRLAAAIAAAPYCHRRLASLQHVGPELGAVQVRSEVVISFD